MTRSTRLLVGGLVIVAALAAWFFLRSGGGDRVAIDLLAQFPNAKDKRPSAAVFEVVDATLAGTRRQAIFAKQPSRVVWNVTIPDDAWLKVQVGLKEEAWTVQGDGVYFMIGISTGQRFDQLYTLVVNPFGNPSDKGWKEIVVDLSPYAGQTVDLVFNTYPSPSTPPGTPPTSDVNGDLPLWGTPQIVIK
jgi:hypothetical protein